MIAYKSTSVSNLEWSNSWLAGTYVSASSFTLAGNKTATYVVDSAIRILNSGNTYYTYVTSSSYNGTSGLTTITIPSGDALDPTLTNSAIAVDLSINIPNRGIPRSLQELTLTGVRGLTTKSFTNTGNLLITSTQSGAANNSPSLILQSWSGTAAQNWWITTDTTGELRFYNTGDTTPKLTISQGGVVYTPNNTLDDGSGNTFINSTGAPLVTIGNNLSNGSGLRIGASSNISAFIGGTYSSANLIFTNNAVSAQGSDSWSLANSTYGAASLVFDRQCGITAYTAIAGKATATFATFWGSPSTLSINNPVTCSGLITGNDRIRSPAGFSGNYGDVGGTAYGGPIWGMDINFTGSAGAGAANWTPTSVYGISWLRSGNANADPYVGEGLYVYQNGSQLAGIGTSGIHTAGAFRSDSTSGNNLFSGPCYLGYFSGVVNMYYGGAIKGQTVSGGFTVTGTLTATYVNATSSLRYKENIRNYNEQFLVDSKFDNLRPVVHDWKDDYLYKKGDKDKGEDIIDRRHIPKHDHIGLIAEEVAELYPSVVSYNEKGEVEGIDYGKLVVPLIAEVQKLKKELSILKGERK